MCSSPACSTASTGRVPGVLFLLLLAACSSRGGGPGRWVGETVQEEGRTIVRTLRGQVWSGPRHLVEQASIGSPVEGPYLLSSVTDLTADGRRIYILDGKDLAVKVYSWDGTFLFSFGPQWVWDVGRDLRILSGFGDTYGFDMYLPGDHPIRVEKAAGLIRVEAEERAWYLARTQALVRSIQPGATYSGPPIPTTKPAYHSLVSDDEGRVWVFRDGPGIEQDGCAVDAEKVSEFYAEPCWVDSLLADVFGPDGRYLGSVRVPAGLSTADPWIQGDTFIGYIHDAEGNPVVKRYRIEPGP